MKSRTISVLFLLFITGLLSLGQLQRIELGYRIAIYAHEILLFIWILYLIKVDTFSKLTKQLWSFFSKNNVTKIVCSVLAVVVSIGWLLALATGQFTFWSVAMTARLSLYLTWWLLILQQKPVGKFWWQLCFTTSGVLITWFGLLQYFILPDVRSLAILGWDDHFYRVISTQLDPNFTGLLLVLTVFWLWDIPFSFWQWLIHGLSNQKLQLLAKTTTLLASAMIGVALFLTFSRSSWVALAVALCWIMFKKRPAVSQKKLITLSSVVIMVVVVLGAVLLMIPKRGEGQRIFRTSTLSARLSYSTSWLTQLNGYQWLIGQGLFVLPATELQPAQTQPAQLRQADHANLPDNLLVLLISSFGIVGSISLVILLVTQREHWPKSVMTQASILAVVTHSMFNNSLLQVFVLLFLLAKVSQEYLPPKVER